MQEFQGQVAIITGGTKGLGFGIAERLGNGGAKVAISGRGSAQGKVAERELLKSDIDSVFVQCDVGEEADVEKLIKVAADRWGRIDILINNAGIVGHTGYLWEIDVEMLDQVYRTNLRGAFLCSQKVLPYMRRQDYGRIINISSIAGKEGNPRQTPYSSTKAAIIGFTKSLGKELADTKITVNAIAPAVIETDILKQCSAEHVQYMLDKIPMKRFGKMEELTNLVAWIASKECSFCTGAVFDLSGGRATY